MNNHTASLAEAISQAYDHTDAAANGKIVTVATGFPDLDFLLGGGLMTPDYMVVAGRPGAGKTAFKVSVAKKVAEMGKKVIIFPLEMVNKQIAMRLTSMESGIPYGSQKSGRLKENEWPLYTYAVEKLSDKNYGIILNDLPAITIPQMRRELRRISIETKIELVIIDYVDLLRARRTSKERKEEIDDVYVATKGLAREPSYHFDDDVQDRFEYTTSLAGDGLHIKNGPDDVDSSDPDQANWVIYDRAHITNNGNFRLGSGAATYDVGFARQGANLLQMDAGDSFKVDGTWDGGTIRLGNYYLWVDAAGKLRIKSGAPTSDTDAGSAIVGTQS